MSKEKVKVTKAQAEAINYFKRTFVENRATSMSNEKLVSALNYGYEVMPEFVSFEEAMKANTKGKVVKSWLHKKSLPYHIHHPRSEEFSKYKLHKFELLGDEIDHFSELKWTIEDDTQ